MEYYTKLLIVWIAIGKKRIIKKQTKKEDNTVKVKNTEFTLRQVLHTILYHDMDTQTLLQEQIKEFKKKFTYGVLFSASSDLSSGKGIRFSKVNQDPQEILDWHKASIKQILQVEVEHLRRTYKNGLDGIAPEVVNTLETIQKHYIQGESIGYNDAITDQINRLTHIIETL